MADRQIIWECSNCDERQHSDAGESPKRPCPHCRRKGFLYPIHDSKMGSSKHLNKNGRLTTLRKKHEVDGSRKANRRYKDVPYSRL